MKAENFTRVCELVDEIECTNEDIKVLANALNDNCGFTLICKSNSRHTSVPVSLESLKPIITEVIKDKNYDLALLEAELHLL